MRWRKFESESAPLLIVFLRQAGCTFCRASLAKLSAQRADIESQGFHIVLVHLGKEEQASEFFKQYALDDLPRISDPECRLYRQFGLDLGGFRALFGLRVWIRGFVLGFLQRHGIGGWQRISNARCLCDALRNVFNRLPTDVRVRTVQLPSVGESGGEER